VRRGNMSAGGMNTEAGAPKAEAPGWWADPGTLGLLGFGTTTILAGLQVGLWTGAGAVLSMAIFFGGIAQIIAGLIGLRRGNGFAAAFLCYGAFWLAFNWMLTAPITHLGVAPDNYGIAAFMFVWMLVTLTFTLSAPKHGIGVTMVFVTLLIAFALLTWMFDATAGGTMISKSTSEGIGGEIILVGLLAWFVATVHLTNAQYGRKFLAI